MELKLIYVCLGKHLLIIFSVRPAQILLLERLIEHKNTLVTKHLSKKKSWKKQINREFDYVSVWNWVKYVYMVWFAVYLHLSNQLHLHGVSVQCCHPHGILYLFLLPCRSKNYDSFCIGVNVKYRNFILIQEEFKCISLYRKNVQRSQQCCLCKDHKNTK